MAPTTDEELKLRLFTGDISMLGPAERFLKVMVDIPFAFKKMELLLFMSSFQEESSSITESFSTLEVSYLIYKPMLTKYYSPVFPSSDVHRL